MNLGKIKIEKEILTEILTEIEIGIKTGKGTETEIGTEIGTETGTETGIIITKKVEAANRGNGIEKEILRKWSRLTLSS